ncbi:MULTISPECIES: hypothetical protein [unclassified Paracoccus (in: a-proteobacteria)]|uniref:hypothetical protein n=1 Tax=unclassified Paracoccus (in: a-proteobacteria) TaxID=2688777 RepID=UPI0012B35D7F|nr:MULTISPECIES: hypothetical protein [unclassified Paracoccus (in: a-proteobacteria)]UXU73789.1 hypothetical protein GB879_007520 [Paracoccus sp. SMMA_5]UXU79679.1 hypothetical protein GB880_007510 [Paracoccus sp. SMMA_5_TC]
MASRSYDPDAYNPDVYKSDRYDEWTGWRDDREVDPIDIDAFNAEQDHIDAIKAQVKAEYARINGPSIFAEIADHNDRHCHLCRGKGFIGSPGEMVQCNLCMGTGAESFVIIRQEDAA